MISGFDHVAIAVRDLAAGVAAYETLLGCCVVARENNQGMASALIAAANMSIELIAPDGDGEMGRRLTAALDTGGEGATSLVFSTLDIDALHRRLDRVGLAPEAIGERPGRRSFRAAAECTNGVRLFFMQRVERSAPIAREGATLGLDHVVIRCGDGERAAALYGARLGLDMRLDREVADRRLMFFRCGDAVAEVIEDKTLSSDRLWGLSWRVADADAARARLDAAGLDVSEVRRGMKPGTRVFTVRSGTCGVPTLMIEPSLRRD
ncbi:MAG: VOC family protein [Hyphomonadaceae bacterium]